MDMLTDLLATVAEGGKILLEEENYLLARISIDGRAMFAEISSGSFGGLPPGGWPALDGVLLPDSLIHPGNDSETRILLFAIPDGAELFIESIVRDGGFSETQALETGKKVLDILRSIHENGYRVGYLGPENVILSDTGEHFILGGARGIPDTPFSPPEAVGRAADDPRSDIYALGLLIFRLIAGSDNRDVQVEEWNKLSISVIDLLEKMVAPEVDTRFPNLMVLSNELERIEPAERILNTETGVEGMRPRKRRKKMPLYIIGVTVIAVIIAIILVMIPDDDPSEESPTADPDTAAVIEETDSTLIAPPPEEIISVQDNTIPEPVIWITNGTGQPGRASEFRQGPASEYSHVYACTGSSRRNSILLARREDPRIPLENQRSIFSMAETIVSFDSTILIKPVDITVLLGNDLTEGSGQNAIIVPVSNPAGTLFVDIANHGVAGTFGGTGAATWVRSVLNNSSILIEGEEWLISVVDYRDGDRQNDELGIPASLDATLFLYRSELPFLTGAEEQIRRLFLDSTATAHPVSITPAPPDIWIILGQ